MLGELFLLLAASLSFFWARTVKHAHDSNAPANAPASVIEVEGETEAPAQAPNNLVYYVEILNFVLVCCAIIACFVIIVFFPAFNDLTLSGFEYDSDVNKNYGYFLSGFVAVFIALGTLLVLFVILAFVVKIAFRSCCNGQEYAPVDGESEESKRCKNTLFTAQIVQDLPVILGLTFMAVGTTLQRGVSNYNLILTVILLITTTGLTTHITNVLRLISLRIQGQQMMEQASATQASAVEGSSAPEMKRLQFNRVLIGLIIAFMLFVFQNLAGLDSVQGMEFASIHQTWFAIFAFVILVCGDLSLEFLAVFQRVYKSQQHYLLHSVAKKSNNTGWLILISLWLLQLHSRHWMCPRYEITKVDPTDPDIPKFCTNLF